MSFLKSLFNDDAQPAGAQRRRWPAQFNDDEALSPEKLLDRRFVYSRVFEMKNREDADKYRRRYVYIGAEGKKDRDMWQVKHFCFDAPDDGALHESLAVLLDNAIVNTHYKRAELPQIFADFEARMASRGNLAVTGSTDNFRLLATRHGTHFDAQGKLFDVDPETPLDIDTTLARHTADRLYALSARAPLNEPLDTWEGFYKRYFDLLDQPHISVHFDKLRQQGIYPHNMARCLQSLDKLKDLKKSLARAPYHAAAQAAVFSVLPRINNSGEPYGLLTYLTDISVIVGVLRTGADVIQNMPDMTDDGINLQKIIILKGIRAAMLPFLEQRLGLRENESRKIMDIMLKGADPRGPQWPLETFFQKYPPMPQTEPPKPGPKADFRSAPKK
jgi:hypothetical protein